MRVMEFPALVPIEYAGQLVALVSTRRIHIVAPWLRTRPAGDPELRFVAYMCLCCGEVLNGRLPGPFSAELAEAWARCALIEDDDVATDAAGDAELAKRLRVPVEQIALVRAAAASR
jgi:hypothetical protein